jgi:hypothetical protein
LKIKEVLKVKIPKIIKNLLVIFIFSLLSLQSLNITAQGKVQALPKLQIVTQPGIEYKNGDTITFTVVSPNYSGKVEYRVILYNGTTKKTSDLWNTPSTGYYYKSWQPNGNSSFDIHWPAKQMDPGAYSMTVLVRRAGSKSGYDSYVDTRAFWVKDLKDEAIENNETNENKETEEIKAPELSVAVYKGLFKNADYSDPGVFLQNGKQTGATSDKFKKLLSNINDKRDMTTLAEIYKQISTIPNGDGEKFGCTVDEILNRNTLTGCTDYGLVFAALSRAKGIPTVFLQTARIDWIKDLREQNSNKGMMRGHILVEVYINNSWYLIDSTSGKLYLNYDKNNFSLDDGYYVFAKSLEVFDMGTKDEMDNYQRMMDIFKDFDMNLYKQPLYNYVRLDNLNETIKSIPFTGEQNQGSADTLDYVIIGTKGEVETLVSKSNLPNYKGYSESIFQNECKNIKYKNIIYFRIKGTPVSQAIKDMVPEIDSIKEDIYKKTYDSGYILIISGNSEQEIMGMLDRVAGYLR